MLAPALVSKPIEIGAEIPAVTVLDESGNTIDLANVLSEGYGLIFFIHGPSPWLHGSSMQFTRRMDRAF